MLRKIVAYATVFALVVCSITFTPKAITAAVPSSEGHNSWSLVWSDEFDQTVGGAPDTSNWSYDIGTGSSGWGNNERQYYTDSTDNVYIADLSGDSESSDGKGLAIKCIKNGDSITSGRIKTQNKVYLKYGRIESKLRVEKGQQSGVWPAFWMLGNNFSSSSNQDGSQGSTGWPGCGEIDIMEHRNAETHILGTIHYNATNSGTSDTYIGSENGGNFGDIDTIENWHTYAVEWYNDVMKFYVDNVCYQTLNIESAAMDEFTREHFILLNLAIGSTNSPFTLGQTISDSFTDATMYVDYVRVFQGTDSDFSISKTGSNAENVTIPEEVTLPYVSLSDKYAYKDNSNVSVVSIQQPGFAAEQGIYITTGAGISKVTINGTEASSDKIAIQGAGVVVYLSALNSYNNIIKLYNGDTLLGSVNLLNFNYTEEATSESTETTTTSQAEESTTTVAAETTTVSSETGAKPDAPAGLVYSGNENLPFYFSWAAADSTTYNFYVNDTLIESGISGGAYNCSPSYFTEAGTYTISLEAVKDGAVSDKTSITYTVTSGSEEQSTESTTTAAPVETTEAVTEAPVIKTVDIEGYQISTSYEGYRMVGSVEPTIDGKNVTGWGFIYGLSNLNGKEDTHITDDDMVVGSDHSYVVSYESTSQGTLNAKMGDSSTATYFARTMKFGKISKGAFVSEYKVRAYALLEDGTYSYSDIVSFTVFDIAKVLYEGKMMNSNEAHTYLYNTILTKVDPTFEEVEYVWNNSVVPPEAVLE